MVQYGSYDFSSSEDSMINKEDGTPVAIPFGKTLRDSLFNFFGDCFSGIRNEEGMVFYLENDKVIHIYIMNVRAVYPLDEYIGFCLEIEEPIKNRYGEVVGNKPLEKNIMIPYDRIIYIEILPYNPETYKMG